MPSIIEIATSALVSNRRLRDLAEQAKGGRSRRFIAKLEEREVGFLCYEDWADQSNGFIYEIYVLPGYREKGIANSLLSYAEELAGSLGCTSIRLQPHAFDRTVTLDLLRSWYANKGYVPMPGDANMLEKALSN
jgi:GNAT superfamily N-acetyltransferase